MFKKIVTILWGDLSNQEIKKFSLLALGFFIIIGSYWPLKALKDGVFINFVGAKYLPDAKVLSLLIYFPLILFYSKIVDFFSKEKLLYIFIFIFGFIGLVLTYFLIHPTIGLENTICGPHRIIGWAFYLFVESYINLLVTIYWAFINDVTTPDSAKKGYGLIAFGMQLGGVIFTLIGSFLSSDTSLYSSRAPLIALISILTLFTLSFVVWSLKHFISKDILHGYQRKVNSVEEKKVFRFLDGFNAIISRPYVAGIFSIIFIYEAVTSILNFQMYSMAEVTFIDSGHLNKFLFDYALMVQALACLFALFGTSFFQRKFGIKFCLVSYPVILGLAIVFYIIYPTLNVVLFTVVLSKALNYSFNQPTKESLYIPTSKEIKYKSKAWIDVFGARAAKTFGSGVYKAVGSLIGLTSVITLGLVGLWIILSDKVGRKFHDIISRNELIH